MYLNSVLLHKYVPWNTKYYYKVLYVTIYYIYSNWLLVNILTFKIHIITYIKLTAQIE